MTDEAPITRPPVPHYYSLTVCGCRRHSLFGVRWVFLSRKSLRRRMQEDKSEEVRTVGWTPSVIFLRELEKKKKKRNT